MPKKAEPKLLTCGCRISFPTPQPAKGQSVWCTTCDAPSRVAGKRNRKPETRVRRKSNPRSNNQWTKGRPLAVEKVL